MRLTNYHALAEVEASSQMFSFSIYSQVIKAINNALKVKDSTNHEDIILEKYGPGRAVAAFLA